MRRSRSKRRVALSLARAQGAFNLVGGLWPIVSLTSFEWIFGRKTDVYLQKTVGGLLATAGLVQLTASDSAESLRVARNLGLAVAGTFLVIDLLYVPAGRIPKTYLLDAAMEIGWIASWARRPL